jgi:hypothetical protein
MAKNRKYIMGSGIAMSPEKDMALFKKMSKQGWHMSGTMLWWYRFEKGEPVDYDYASNMEGKVTKDMLSMYEESGWLPIVAVDGFQIFRAIEGAAPIFSDTISEIEALEEIRRNTVKCGTFWGFVLILVLILAPIAEPILPISDNLVRAAFAVIHLFLVFACVPNFVAFFGLSKIIRKKRKQNKPSRNI